MLTCAIPTTHNHALTGDSFYKITSEALLVCTAFISVMRPDLEVPLDAEFSAPLQKVFDCVFAKLSASDVITPPPTTSLSVNS